MNKTSTTTTCTTTTSTTFTTTASAMKCVVCWEALSKPAIFLSCNILPCGHLICQSHAQTSDKTIFCSICDTYHENKRLLSVKKVDDDATRYIAEFEKTFIF